MLVLTRKPNEKVIIGDGIEVVVLEIFRNRVRLGFRVPPEVPVHRGEVYQRIHAHDSTSPPPMPAGIP
ncbi:MAG: carbon storage regulator [Candidatus Andersenbacteria bacterium]|nr:carbon storage regulator [Candidatus Andersenbacteria bacterium]